MVSENFFTFFPIQKHKGPNLTKFYFLLFTEEIAAFTVNSEESDQRPRSVPSDLGLYCV